MRAMPRGLQPLRCSFLSRASGFDLLDCNVSETGIDLWFQAGAKKQSVFLAMEAGGVSGQL